MYKYASRELLCGADDEDAVFARPGFSIIVGLNNSWIKYRMECTVR